MKEENAKGGVNGRKIVPVIADDSGSTNNLVAAQNLVQNEKVFLVVNNSPFAFLGYRFLLDNGVPMVGGGYDGNEYGQPGNEKLISILGNNFSAYGAQYKGGFVDLMKKAGAKNVGTVAYGVLRARRPRRRRISRSTRCPRRVSTRRTRTRRSTSARPTSARWCSV